MNSFIDALVFLISACAQLYIFIVLLKILLQLCGIDYLNPLSQFVLRFTAPIFQPLQKIIPRFNRIDIVAIVFVIALNALKIFFITLLTINLLPNILWLTVYSFVDVVRLLIELYYFLIIIYAVLSWILPFHGFPLVYAITRLVNPLLMRVQRIIPPISSIDFSAIIILLLLWLLNNSLIIKWLIPVLYGLTFET